MKTWIKTNLSKITLALALTGAISGVTGLIIGSITHHKTNNLQYFLDYDGKVHWGGLVQRYGQKKKMIFIKYMAFLPLCTILILSHKCWEKPIYGLLPTFLNQT